MKRLRILLERMGFDVAHKLRYFIVSEYGSPEKTFRPHYHGILWNFPYLDDNRLLNDVMTQEVIEKAWSYGFVKCLPLLTGGAAYVMKYMRKDGKVPPGKNKPFWMYIAMILPRKKSITFIHTHPILRIHMLTLRGIDTKILIGLI